MSGDLLQILSDPAILFVDLYLSKYPADSPEAKLLSVFAYGSWKDYAALKSSLPSGLQLDPNGPAAKKLKKLTIISILSANPVYKFEDFRHELDLANTVDLESLIIDLMASESIVAKIDEQSNCVKCERSVARCVRNDPTAIQEVIKGIQKVRGNINAAIAVAGPSK
jgi:hypothetical protein